MNIMLSKKEKTKRSTTIWIISSNSLKERVQELTVKVRQLTSFIEAKGLVAAFKEFLKPKPKSIVEVLKENKAKVEVRREQPRTVPDKKKR